MSKQLPINVAGAAATLRINAAAAGPPMVTDDTGTAAPGTLEIIAYAEGNRATPARASRDRRSFLLVGLITPSRSA